MLLVIMVMKKPLSVVIYMMLSSLVKLFPFAKNPVALNAGEGCFYLGVLYYIKLDEQQAKTFYEKACGLNCRDGG